MSENKMNKIFDERKISTFRDFKDLVRSNKLIGRREICIVVDRLELENVIYKAEMYDEVKKDYKKRKIVRDKEINRLNNIINEAIGFTNSHFKEMVADEEAQALLSILNKGSEENVKKNNTNSN